jgi:FkbM family methyltransferase
MLSVVRMLIGAAPVQFGIGGRAEASILRTLDPLFSHSRCARVRTSLGFVDVDMRHAGQRLLAYCFHNLRRHYASSALGKYIRGQARGRTFVDVGANLGFYSLLAREAGLNAVAFEPEPSFAQFLQRNESVFGHAFAVALADKDDRLPLYILPGNSGASSLVPQPDCELLDSTVSVRTFSEFALDGRLGDPSHIDLVKIDVEGAEEATVRGMKPFLAAGHRPDIWCEVRGNRARRARGSATAVREMLEPLGYTMFDAPEHGEPGPFPSEEVFSSRSVFDALFRAPR